ncbi:hypothetical protein DCAR_0935379 [Daucus carota subsp. sativus]|uniref:Uncharacterized protein n=1 Tax=Daucus carota subsp. sativus TaxID=79200 RepID=A0AAF1BFE5_DAUCS|nr:hypothetical protein DCAR_0207367 [Daucus carota subsp. sativus]WOH15833.1 hypothetical protein DCAR_0935379 [Daucus carota subsp. sativus]
MTFKGTFFGNYKPRNDILGVVEKYMNKVQYALFDCCSPADYI